METRILELIRERAATRLLFLDHAAQQMMRPERMIESWEVEQTVKGGEIIEDYPGDDRGHSCLILGRGNHDRPIHVVCAPKDEFLAIITAYIPDVVLWSGDFRTRRK